MVQVQDDANGSGTLRTRTSEYDYPDMTALELARLFGYTHMYDILSPIVRHAIPHKTLKLVQQQFHTLIKHELSPQTVDEQHIRLPELEVLTELDGGPMWFPLSDHKFENAVSFKLRISNTR